MVTIEISASGKLMSHIPTITFAKPTKTPNGLVFILIDENGAASQTGAEYAGPSLQNAIAAAEFKSKLNSTVEILVPASTEIARLVVVGTGKVAELNENNWLKLGGTVASKLGAAKTATVLLEIADHVVSASYAADFALGLMLRAYKFDKYKTKKDDDAAPKSAAKVTILVADPAAAKKAFASRQSVFGGVELARNLVNEPANILGTLEFAAEAKNLEKLGVKIDILTEKEMKKLGMGALLGVAQGSVRPPRMVIMHWNGGKEKQKPIAFVGKGVVFDSGGISIKPAAGMEDMKGDMGGAAAVTGLMHTLASRKAKANVIGIIGLVENMVDANAQRPGDIVTAMSGTTIEVLNTDAEGRLVLADALHYCRTKFEPEFMVNLATLTGAILVALGNQYAGLFSNNDELSDRMTKAGLSTGERLWRMPMGADYDKLIDTPNADVKNIGGRYAGSITAAQFLQRFVGETKWAHLDIAGTAMGSPASEINGGWASGYGVRLLDRLVSDHYEG
jgi:leucyl aminopeptidase